jgi:hypothetical protein
MYQRYLELCSVRNQIGGLGMENLSAKAFGAWAG